ncbi:GNAT family N-acetyltransferase [Aquirufa regiilacus]|jgi:RimJ/RimL family protein N-acetyltransferase
MQIIQTNRLLLRPISLDDADFIMNLINCPGFIRYIGDRNVRTRDQAIDYLQNMLGNPDITYWAIETKLGQVPVGVVTWVKRDFLPSPDLGYALLPEYEGNGYAFEASEAWLAYQLKTHKSALAICQADNLASIKLLLKLNFVREEIFEKEGHEMHRYSLHS